MIQAMATFGGNRPHGRRRTEVKRRTYHPVDIRDWVIDQSPEVIHAALAAKIDAIDEATTPYRDALGAFFHDVLSETARHWVDSRVTIRRSEPASSKKFTRSGALIVIARYWSDRPCEGKFLPRIVPWGSPWDVREDEISVLDLGIDQIRTVLRSPMFAEIRRFAEQYRTKPSVTRTLSAISDLWVAEAIQLIRFSPVTAIVHPVVLPVMSGLIRAMSFPANEKERRRAKILWRRMSRAWEPDRRRQRGGRRDIDVLLRLKKYEELYAKFEPLHSDLRRAGPLRKSLARFRDRVDPRIDLSDLKHWAEMTASNAAIEWLAGLDHLSAKTFAEHLTLGRKARKIQQAWEGYRASPIWLDPASTTPVQHPPEQTKFELVRRVLRGEAVETVALDGRVSVPELHQLVENFVASGRRALKGDAEPAEHA